MENISAEMKDSVFLVLGYNSLDLHFYNIKLTCIGCFIIMSYRISHDTWGPTTSKVYPPQAYNNL